MSSRDRSRPLTGPCCLAIIASAALFGCDSAKDLITQKVTDKVVEEAIERQVGVDTSGERVSIKTKDDKGNEFILEPGGGKVPEDWPKDVPIYPGAVVAANAKSSKANTLVLQVDDSPQQVIDFYKGKLSSMEQKAFMDIGGKFMMTLAEKDGRRQIMVNAGANEGKAAAKGKTYVHLAVNEGNAK
jgi:hypothetical protein